MFQRAVLAVYRKEQKESRMEKIWTEQRKIDYFGLRDLELLELFFRVEMPHDHMISL